METDFYEYSLFELTVTPKGKDKPMQRNFLVPTKDWQFYLDKYEKHYGCKINRAVLLAERIETTPDHDFNYGAQ